jgi:multidrug efflux pump subunit AcrA (membrane-fusion protein)
VKKLLVGLVLIGLALVSAAYWLNTSGRSAGESQFATASVDRGPLAEVINATGIIQPREVIAVSASVAGEAVKIFPGADFNRTVEKGQPLLQIDDRAARLRLERSQITVELAKRDVESAQAAVDAAQSALDRARDAHAKGAIKNHDLDLATLNFKMASAKHHAAQVKVNEAEQGVKADELALTLTTLRAPADGVIIDRKVFMGQVVGPQLPTPIFTIAADLDQVQVLAQIAEGDISKIIPGLRATFTVYSSPDGAAPIEGIVEQTRLTASNVGGAVFYSAVLNVKNQRIPQTTDTNGWVLRPGMTANVDIQRRRHDDVWRMPNAALSFQLDDSYQSPEAKAKLENWQPPHGSRDDWKAVWVLKNKRPSPLFVRTGGVKADGEPGVKDGQFTEILEWDTRSEAAPDPARLADYPLVIIAAPPVTKPGIFDRPSLKLS